MTTLGTPRTISLATTLPEPPSANRYWRHVGVKTLLSAQARAYRKSVQTRLLTHRFVAPKEGESVGVTLKWYRSRKCGDLDNRIKQLLDALKGIAYADDAEITHIEAERFDDKRNPRVEVAVYVR